MTGTFGVSGNLAAGERDSGETSINAGARACAARRQPKAPYNLAAAAAARRLEDT